MPAKAKPAPFTFAKLKKLALALKLPGITETTSWGQPCLKAHGTLWLWWSPHCAGVQDPARGAQNADTSPRS